MTATPPGTPASEFLSGQEITTTDCRRCGTQIAGVNGRYACGACGWTNPWDEGHTALPTADDDTAA
jgi:ribosomal protein S27AE